MFLLTIAFPLVYTALYVFAVLFLVKTKNEKFYQKILFSVFVVSAATWGWAELLQNIEGLRSMAYWFTKIGFASALLGVEALLLICLELLNLHLVFRRFWFFYVLTILTLTYCFLPGFIVQGFAEVDDHLAIVAGYADFFYTYLIILSTCVTLFLFLLVYKTNDLTTRKRVAPIIFAFMLTVSGGVFFNIFLPIQFNNEAFSSLAPISMGGIVIALIYSVVKWNFLGISFTGNVSYSHISHVWKHKDKEFFDEVRHAYEQVSALIPAEGPKIKNIFFSGGTVSQKGNVYLFRPKISFFIFVSLSFIRNFFPQKFYTFDKGAFPSVVFILDGKKGGWDFSEYESIVVEVFSLLSSYQRAAEGVISSHLKTNERKQIL